MRPRALLNLLLLLSQQQMTEDCTVPGWDTPVIKVAPGCASKGYGKPTQLDSIEEEGKVS